MRRRREGGDEEEGVDGGMRGRDRRMGDSMRRVKE